MDLNLTAVWAGAVAAARDMAAGGAMINTSSRAAQGGHVKNGPDAAAKAAVNSLTQTLARYRTPADIGAAAVFLASPAAPERLARAPGSFGRDGQADPVEILVALQLAGQAGGGPIGRRRVEHLRLQLGPRR